MGGRRVSAAGISLPRIFSYSCMRRLRRENWRLLVRRHAFLANFLLRWRSTIGTRPEEHSTHASPRSCCGWRQRRGRVERHLPRDVDETADAHGHTWRRRDSERRQPLEVAIAERRITLVEILQIDRWRIDAAPCRLTNQMNEASTSSAPTALLAARIVSRSPRMVRGSPASPRVMSGSRSSTPLGQTSL